jgi:putative inorganic carbon (hco3(-)) transporter
VNNTASKETPKRKARGANSRELGLDIKPIESSVPFVLYMAFLAFFYLRFAARFPPIAPFRPDMIMAILVTLSIVPYLSQRVDLFRLPAARALSMLILWIIVSMPFVQWPGSVLRENWFPFVKAVLLFYFTILVVDTPNRLRWAVFLFLGFQVFRILEPLYLNITQGYTGGRTHLGAGEFADRLSGAPADVINPNGLGFVIASCVVFIHFLLWKSPSKVLKLAYLMLMPAMLYALILSMSRGGFIALLVGGFLIFWQSRQKAALVVVAIAAVMFAWNVMTDVQRERYLSLVSPDTEQSAGVEGRLTGMTNEFKLGMNRPLFGHGLGTTPEAKVNVLGGKREASHSLYAELLIEIGIGGFVLFVLFLWRVHRLVRDNLEQLAHASESNPAFGFYSRLNGGLFVVFWVYAVYSLNYYGLSQDYWYLFAGLCTSFGFIMRRSDPSLGHEAGLLSSEARAAS